MDHELLAWLEPFRVEAAARGIPSADVERWIADARPSATLVTSGEGPVVGRFGGPLLLPPGAPDPWFPFLATLDCAALPEEVTGLPLPADGTLLLFGLPSGDLPECAGEAMYIPAGTPVEERTARNPCVYGTEEDRHEGEVADDEDVLVHEQFPDEELRLAADVSLPHHHLAESAEPPYTAPLPGHPRAEELAAVWQDAARRIAVDGPLHVGGYASAESVGTDPAMSAAGDAVVVQQKAAAGPDGAEEPPEKAEWVLLAQWDVGLEGREGGTLHWVIPRVDLAGGRFDRVHASFDWNP